MTPHPPMTQSHLHSASATLLLVLTCGTLHAQGGTKVQPCFFSEDFSNGMPAGWDIGPDVERQTGTGIGLGEFVPAWTVGNSAEANANGFFPVPDVPANERFVMANDDAAPCNCAMADVALTAPAIDLSGRTNVALQCRVFNEGTLGAGNATIEASTDGNTWTTLMTIDAVIGTWQDLFTDLSAYDGTPALRLRFHWSDGGGWAGGFAVDDVCLRERHVTDLAVVRAYTHDASASAFQPGDQGLRYSRIPLEQIAPMTVSARIRNLGTSVMGGTLTAEFLLNGTMVHTSAAQDLGALAIGRDTLIVIATNWTPDNTGSVEVRFVVAPASTDDDPADNTASASLRITGEGWDGDYFNMAADEGDPQGQVGGNDPFITAVRLETIAGSTAHGITAGITALSTAGSVVRAILFDANLAMVDTSVRHILTQADLDSAALGQLLYLPFAHTPVLGEGDHFVGIQLLLDDVDGPVHVSTSGHRPAGADILMTGTTFDVTHLSATPMVRLHLGGYGVGMPERIAPDDQVLLFHPVPTTGPLQCQMVVRTAGKAQGRVLDMSGREVRRMDLGTLIHGPQRLTLDIGDMPVGAYLIELTVGGTRSWGRVVLYR